MDILAILTAQAAAAAHTEALRRAVRPDPVTLSAGMASIMGRPTRQRVPFLGVALEAATNKLFVRRLATDKATSTKTLAGWLATNGWPLLERDLWRAALRDGRAYLLVTYEGGAPRLTLREEYNGAEGAFLLADGTPVNVHSLAGRRCVDFFYADRIEKYAWSEERREYLPRQDAPDEAWPLPWTDTAGAPLGPALVAFGSGESAIAVGLQTQADLNEALLDLGAVSRSQGWPQRYVSNEDSGGVLMNVHRQPITDALGRPFKRELKLEPGSLLRLSGEKAQLGQLPAADLDRTAVDVHLEVLSLLTAVPTHYFTGQWPSGVALLQSERRLDAKAEHWQSVFTPPLQRAVAQMFSLEATYGQSAVNALVVAVDWFPPQVETEDLIGQRAARTATLYEKGLLSVEAAVDELHPEWTIEQRAEEVARLSVRATAAVRIKADASTEATPGED